MILQSNQSAACQNPATLLMRLRWLDFGNSLLHSPIPRPLLTILRWSNTYSCTPGTRYTESNLYYLFHADTRAKNAHTSGATIYGRSLRVTAFASFNELNIGASLNPPHLLLVTISTWHLQTGRHTTSMKPTSSCIEDNITRWCFLENHIFASCRNHR